MIYFIRWRNQDRFKIIEQVQADEQVLQSAVHYFQYFDTDKSGTINSTEFKTLYADLVKHRFTTQSLDDCLRELDRNGDGEISVAEYIDWLIRIGSIKGN